jgi:hypothetical protein
VEVAPALQAAELAAGGGEAAQLAVLVHWVADPVDARVLQGEGRGRRRRVRVAYAPQLMRLCLVP